MVSDMRGVWQKMKYPFLPNINKTKILDGIELSLPQQLFIAKCTNPLNPRLSVGLIWDRGTGQSYARAVLYVEQLLYNYFNDIDKNIEIKDHYNDGNDFKANRNMVDIIVELLRRDNFIVCLFSHRYINKLSIVRQDKPKTKHKDYQFD